MIDTMASTRQRIGTRDIVIAAFLSALGVLLMVGNVFDGERLPDGRSVNPDERAAIHIGNLLPLEFALGLFLLVTVPLLWRRTAPLEATAAALAGVVINVLLLGSEFLRCGVILPTAFLLAFAAGSTLDGRRSWIALGLALAMPSLDLGLTFDPLTAVVLSSITVVVWAAGRIVRSRRRLGDELKARTEELRVARDHRAQLEVATDRARISHELDELLQRRLGELAKLADEEARPADAAGATATLVGIERESRRTLEEMRAVVGVLRSEPEGAPTAPQPTLTHLEALLVGAKGGGARLSVEGSPRVLPPSIELSAYRVVEHLLDALEDSPDVAVRVRFGDDALELAVSGPARRKGKAALERARERARLEHGRLDATVRGGRADAVVTLPVAS